MLMDWNLVDRLHDTRHFIHKLLYILSGCAAAEETEPDMVEISKVYDETERELYMGAGDREHD
jgi:hypothetical protein